MTMEGLSLKRFYYSEDCIFAGIMEKAWWRECLCMKFAVPCLAQAYSDRTLSTRRHACQGGPACQKAFSGSFAGSPVAGCPQRWSWTSALPAPLDPSLFAELFYPEAGK